MKSHVKILLWELCLQISAGFIIFGETSLFIGLSSGGDKVPFGCSLLAGITSLIGFAFTILALWFCDRNKTWQRLATNVALMIVMALIGKSFYLLMS